MWFKNIQAFRLVAPFQLRPDQLEDYLLNDVARPFGQLEMSTYGWTPPLGWPHTALTHSVNGCIILAAKKQDKLLPRTVVRDQVEEQIALMEQEQSRSVGTRERRQMMDETTVKLMSKVLVKSSTLWGYIDVKNQWILVNTASRAKAEEFIILLRKSLGSLQVMPFSFKRSISKVLTRWVLNDELPSDFTFESQCELRAPQQEKNIVRMVNQEVQTHEVLQHIEAGKEIIKLALTWNDRVSFVLHHEFSLKQIHLLDLVKEQVEDTELSTKEELFHANAAMICGEFSLLLPRLCEALGGVAEEVEREEAVAV